MGEEIDFSQNGFKWEEPLLVELPSIFGCLETSVCWVMTIFRSENGPKWAMGDPLIEQVKFPSFGYYFHT